MKNSNRLTRFIAASQRLLRLYLTIPFGCEIAALKVVRPSSEGK